MSTRIKIEFSVEPERTETVLKEISEFVWGPGTQTPMRCVDFGHVQAKKCLVPLGEI